MAEILFTSERAEAAFLRFWVEHDLVRAIASIEVGVYSLHEARAEFFALASIRADLGGIEPELARRGLVGMLEEVLPRPAAPPPPSLPSIAV